MGRRKSKSKQLPTTIVVPSFQYDSNDTSGRDAGSPESWEGYPEPVTKPTKTTQDQYDAPAPRKSSTISYTGEIGRVTIPAAAEDKDGYESESNASEDDADVDVDARDGGDGLDSSRTPSLTKDEAAGDTSQAYAQLDKKDALRLVLPKRALDDPFAAVDPFAAANPFGAAPAPATARQRGSRGRSQPPVQVPTTEATEVGTTCHSHSRALKGAIPPTAGPRKPATTDDSVPWPQLLPTASRPVNISSANTAASDPFGSPSDPFGSPMKESDSDVPFAAFGPDSSTTA
eukprot:m.102726 g.102726  ORF g.102726 m.102726 type:complete len:288 (+) comp10446_c1_seq3:253-1116(+)